MPQTPTHLSDFFQETMLHIPQRITRVLDEFQKHFLEGQVHWHRRDPDPGWLLLLMTKEVAAHCVIRYCPEQREVLISSGSDPHIDMDGSYRVSLSPADKTFQVDLQDFTFEFLLDLLHKDLERYAYGERTQYFGFIGLERPSSQDLGLGV